MKRAQKLTEKGEKHSTWSQYPTKLSINETDIANPQRVLDR